MRVGFNSEHLYMRPAKCPRCKVTRAEGEFWINRWTKNKNASREPFCRPCRAAAKAATRAELLRLPNYEEMRNAHFAHIARRVRKENAKAEKSRNAGGVDADNTQWDGLRRWHGDLPEKGKGKILWLDHFRKSGFNPASSSPA